MGFNPMEHVGLKLRFARGAAPPYARESTSAGGGAIDELGLHTAYAASAGGSSSCASFHLRDARLSGRLSAVASR